MRAQASLELFFALSLFLLVLFWMNHFLGTAAESFDAQRMRMLVSQAESFAEAASASCLLSANVSVPAPCVGPDGAFLSVSGNVVTLSGASAQSRCAFASASFPVACDAFVCARPGTQGVTLTPGECGAV
ncbi:MAG: hypothetical protein Q8P02_04720 [Candidatus Micrarchaeota archaeon]|nr:hypothetical protein [Candidatus Micrarchaeota archaeon]